MKQFLFLILAMFFTLSSRAQDGPKYQKFVVISVHDGDTFTATDESGNKSTFRPIGYDAPEIRSNLILETQPYGRIAGDTLRKLIKGKTILLDLNALKPGEPNKSYERILCEAYFADSSSIALWMVKNGFAWAAKVDNRRFPKMNTIIRNAHRLARENDVGLWTGYLDLKGKRHFPESPWSFRKKYYLIE